MSGNTSALAKPRRFREMAAYVTGFIDGEGSFLVSFHRRSGLVTGIEVRPSFSVSQHKRNVGILQGIRDDFNCGAIRFDRHDQTYTYEVRSLNDVWRQIIPHFRWMPLRTAKKKDFDAFVEICSLMKMNRHRSREGIEQILSLAYSMNNYGARKYKLHDLLQIVRKKKV